MATGVPLRVASLKQQHGCGPRSLHRQYCSDISEVRWIGNTCRKLEIGSTANKMWV